MERTSNLIQWPQGPIGANSIMAASLQQISCHCLAVPPMATERWREFPDDAIPPMVTEGWWALQPSILVETRIYLEFILGVGVERQ